MVTDLILVPTAKKILSTIASRAIGKKSDPLLLLVGIEGHTEEMLHEVHAKLVEMQHTLDGVATMSEAALLKPLKAGFLKLNEYTELPERLQQGALDHALADFNDILALPYDGDLQGVTRDMARSMALFGKAAVLHEAGAKPELVTRTSIEGFMAHPTIARSYMSEEIWKGLIKDVYKGHALVEFNYSARVDSYINRYGSFKILGRNSKPAHFLGLLEDKKEAYHTFEFGYDADTSRWLAPLSQGGWNVSAEASLSYRSAGVGQYGVPKIDNWKLKTSPYIEVDAGMRYSFSIAIRKTKSNFFSKDDYGLSVVKSSVKAIDIDSEEYRRVKQTNFDSVILG